jgi:hypothetical protein
MARRRYNNPKPQTTMHLSVEACEYLEGHKISRTEPKHEVLDRVISEHEQQKDLIEDLEWELKDQKQTIENGRRIRLDLEQQLQTQLGLEKPLSNR